MLRPQLRPSITAPSTPALLTVAFAAFYFAIGPGCFFSVDEVVVEAMARAVYSRNNLEVPAMNTATLGREGGYYVGHRGPALSYVAMPFVAIGDLLDNRFGSLNGGIAEGPAMGTLEHPLRWGGRLSIFVALAANAIFGGLTVAVLYMISMKMSGSYRTALWVATAAGLATLLVSESTHFFQHVLEALMLLTGFWFLISADETSPRRRAWLGGLALGLAVLTRPSAAPAATVIWCCGVVLAWRLARADDRKGFVDFFLRALAAPVSCAVAYLTYNNWQFGNALQIGGAERAFEFSSEALKATAAYLVSPGLSVFLFSSPLILVPFCLRAAKARWPLETASILLSCAAYSLVIVFFRWWDGSISYGPRYMLAPILLLMPLVIPAVERAVQRHVRWKLAFVATILFGFAVQFIGVSVYIAVNEWYQNQHNLAENGAFVFIPSASPIWVQFQEFVAGRNLTMWAGRALSQKSLPLSLLVVGLLAVSATCYWHAMKSTRPNGNRLPAVATIGVAALVLIGFAYTQPITTPVSVRVDNLVTEGLAAQQAGLSVKAEELYAVVLGLDRSNKYALHNLAILYEGAGRTADAISLYRRALTSDPAFAPAMHNLARLRPVPEGACATPPDCYALGQRFIDSGDVAGALNVWSEASNRFPSEGWLLRNVAWCRYRLGDYTGAVRDYTTAAAWSPDDDGIRTDLAWSLLRAARFEEARRMSEDVLRRDKGNAAAKAILAQLPSQ